MRTIAIIAGTLLCSGCVHNPAAFRLTPGGTTNVLVPPGVKDASVVIATVRVPSGPKKPVCSASPHGLQIGRRSGNQRKVIVSRDALLASTGAELLAWVAQLEQSGCIRSGEAFALTRGIIDALPLTPQKRGDLASGSRNFTELYPGRTLQIISPIIAPGLDQDATPTSPEMRVSAGPPGVVNVEMTAAAALGNGMIGYEIAWYDPTPRADGPGFRLTPRKAEANVDGKISTSPEPRINYLQFEPDARWYRVFTLTRSSSNDSDFAVVSAASASELERRTADFGRDAAGFLKSASPESLAVLPRRVGMNCYVRVTLNGAPAEFPLGSTVGRALGQTGKVPQQLRIEKPRAGRLFPVDWDHAKTDILNLPLEGGEVIAW